MLENGAPTRTRTADPLITNQVLYQLSYRGTLSLISLAGCSAKCGLWQDENHAYLHYFYISRTAAASAIENVFGRTNAALATVCPHYPSILPLLRKTE